MRLLATVVLLAAPSSSRVWAAAPIRPELITLEAEKAIKNGLAYLARTQSRDGSWRSGESYGAYPCAMTSLAGLALLAGGNTPHEGPYAPNVRRAVDFVLGCADHRTGLISRLGEEARPMYGHGFAMLFLAEAYGMGSDPSRQAAISRVLHRAVELTGRSQSAAGGWLYAPDQNGDEGSVTITQIQGLRACRNAGIKVPKSIIDRAVQYIGACACKDGGIAYSIQGGGSRPAITAAAVATLYNAGAYDHPVAKGALEYLKARIKGGSVTRAFMGHAYYSMLYLAQAMFLSGEQNWKEYFPECRDQLVTTQNPTGSWMGDSVGETYGTAIALIVLQLPYKYVPVLQR